jgi:hypothetical protein
MGISVLKIENMINLCVCTLITRRAMCVTL